MTKHSTTFCVFLLLCSFARGAILVTDVWDVAESWTNRVVGSGPGSGYATLTNPDADLEGSGESGLLIERSSGALPEVDLIYANQDLAGNEDWTSIGATPGEVKSIWFNFYTDAGGLVDYPAGLRIYFASGDAGGTNIWYYNLDVATLSLGWNSLAVEIYATASYAWYSETGTETDWIADFQDVDEVGIWLSYHPGYLNQVYGIDDFRLSDQHIPEPGTWLMLGVASLSLCVTFRQKVRGSLDWLKRLGRKE